MEYTTWGWVWTCPHPTRGGCGRVHSQHGIGRGRSQPSVALGGDAARPPWWWAWMRPCPTWRWPWARPDPTWGWVWTRLSKRQVSTHGGSGAGCQTPRMRWGLPSTQASAQAPHVPTWSFFFNGNKSFLKIINDDINSSSSSNFLSYLSNQIYGYFSMLRIFFF